MNIHEYQGKELLKQYGLPIAHGVLIRNIETASFLIDQLSSSSYVVKSQIHAGGRGKGRFKELEQNGGGGVRLALSKQEALDHIKEMLGNTIVTEQTGPLGKKVNLLYVEEAADIDQELYLSLLVDAQTSQVSFIVSTEGGVNIEEVAHHSPEKIKKISIDPTLGITEKNIDDLNSALRFDQNVSKESAAIFSSLYQVFVEKDMSLLEVNPLIIMKNGKIRILDLKISFDDNALFRHSEILSLRDLSEEDVKEVEASKHDLAYVALNGNIGCMVNGAGLAMATMDIIKLHGGEPANFLDVGGGASKENVIAAFKIIAADPSVKGILVNIFGGIMQCNIIAEGIVDSLKEINLSVPLVVRLQGTNVDAGKKILLESNFNIIAVDDLDEAAQKIVAVTQ